MRGTRLYVGNIPWNAQDSELRDHFAQAGAVTEVKLIMDRETGKPRGFGFIDMSTPDEAEQAIRELDGADFGGRPLRVSEAQERARRGPGGPPPPAEHFDRKGDGRGRRGRRGNGGRRGARRDDW